MRSNRIGAIMRKWYRRKTIDGKRINIHKILIEEQLGRSLSVDELVHHKDGNSRNNSITNLELMSRTSHFKLHLAKCKRVYNKGGEHGRAKLIEEDVIEIRHRLQSGELAIFLAKEYNVSNQTISCIKLRQTWKHI